MTNHARVLTERHRAASGAYLDAMVAHERDHSLQNGPLRRQLRAEFERVDAEMSAYLEALRVTRYPAAPAHA